MPRTRVELGAMNRSKLSDWIEQAEARAYCELATAEPGTLKLLPASDAVRRAAPTRVAGFICRLRRQLHALDRARAAA